MTNFPCSNWLLGAAGALLTFASFSTSLLAQEKPVAPPSGAAPGTPVVPPQAPATTTPAKEKTKFVRYLRVGEKGADARNLGDANGVSVAKLSAGSLVAVFAEHGDWLECEVPGGFEIWVYGQYVKASSEAGVLEITGSDVRARPLASSGPESYPLQPNLSRGERVRLITRNDSTKPLAEDWVKVYSPPGVRGFVAKSDCEPLSPGMDGAAAWSNAVIEARKRTPATTLGADASNAKGAAGPLPQGDLSPQEAVLELQRADSALAHERRSTTKNFAPIRAQYQRVLASLKEGATADMARRGLSEVDALIELQAIESELQAERERAEAEALKRQVALAEAAKDKDIYSGRFETRGWLEKRTIPGKSPTYLLRWGGEEVSEILCNSGRYDLSAFAGYEIGVNGRELRSFTPGDVGRVPVPRLIDAARIEVLAGKPAAR